MNVLSAYRPCGLLRVLPSPVIWVLPGACLLVLLAFSAAWAAPESVSPSNIPQGVASGNGAMPGMPPEHRAASQDATPQNTTPQDAAPHAGHMPQGNASAASAPPDHEEKPDPHAGHMVPPPLSSGTPSAPALSSAPAASTPGVPVVSGAPTGTASALSPGGQALLNVQPGAKPPIPSMVEHLGMTVPEGIMLRDEGGALLDVRSLMDVPTIIVPVFYTCPAGCNTLLASMAATLGGVDIVPGKDFRVISVSFDEDDTPERAARKKSNYFAAMGKPFPEDGWRFLTGDAASIQHFMGAIGFPYIRLGPGNFSHPLGVIVLAPGGKIVRYMYGQSFLPFDITMAVHEAAQGKVGLSIKRIVSYCFTYDPAARGYVFNFMRVAGITILFGAGVFLAILLLGGKKKRPFRGERTGSAHEALPPPDGDPATKPLEHEKRDER